MSRRLRAHPDLCPPEKKFRDRWLHGLLCTDCSGLIILTEPKDEKLWLCVGSAWRVYDPCPLCGACNMREQSNISQRVNEAVERKVVRWVSTEVWWNPKTWQSGYWERLPETDLEKLAAVGRET